MGGPGACPQEEASLALFGGGSAGVTEGGTWHSGPWTCGHSHSPLPCWQGGCLRVRERRRAVAMVTWRAVQLGVGLRDKGASDSCRVRTTARPWAVLL